MKNIIEISAKAIALGKRCRELEADGDYPAALEVANEAFELSNKYGDAETDKAIRAIIAEIKSKMSLN